MHFKSNYLFIYPHREIVDFRLLCENFHFTLVYRGYSLQLQINAWLTQIMQTKGLKAMSYAFDYKCHWLWGPNVLLWDAVMMAYVYWMLCVRHVSKHFAWINHSIFIRTLWTRYYYYPHFTNEKSEWLRHVTFLRSNGVVELGIENRQSGSRACIFVILLHGDYYDTNHTIGTLEKEKVAVKKYSWF